MPKSKYSQRQTAKTVTATGKLKKPDLYICTRCGTVFNKADHRKHFSTVKSSLWENNENKLPICNDCLKFYYDFYLKSLGDPHSAYRRVCMKFDIYYNADIVDSILKTDQSSDRIGAYISQLNYARHQGKTYDNTIEEEAGKMLYGDCVYNDVDEDGNPVNIKEEYEKLKKELSDSRAARERNVDDTESDPECEDLFGFGFTGKEQRSMKKYYIEQKNNIPQPLISVLDEHLKNLARFRIFLGRSIEKDSLEEISKYNAMFEKSRKYIDDAVAKYKKNAATEENNVQLGSLIESVENFCPAEIYKKKTIFSDVDEISEFIKRFAYRPIKNFFTGSRESDPEYNVDEV